MNSSTQLIARIAISLSILGAGLGISGLLIASKATTEALPQKDVGVSVRTQKVKARQERVTVAAQGTVVPAREVSLQPEVQGRVTYANQALVPGGRFKKGEVLLRIDASEYALRAKQSATEVAQAEQQLMLEQSRQEIAAQEWQLIGVDESASEAGRAVALRKPQMKEAEARRDLAQHSRDLAKLNVGRTALVAPFNGIVRSGNVTVGQYISPAVNLGTLVSSDEYWVQVSIPVARLTSIRVPGFNAETGEGSEASVWQEVGDQKVERLGRVVRLYGDVDPMGRMARVLVEIKDPLGLQTESAEKALPLLLGAYVHVNIEGESMMDVIEVPRSAVHSGRYVYVFGPDERLLVRDVEIAWRKPESFLLRSGLKDGEEIVTSRISTAIDGVKLRRADENAAGGKLSRAGEAPDAVEPAKWGGTESPEKSAAKADAAPAGKAAP